MFHALKGVAPNPAPYMKGDRLRKLHQLLARVGMMKNGGRSYQATHGGEMPKRCGSDLEPSRARKSAKVELAARTVGPADGRSRGRVSFRLRGSQTAANREEKLDAGYVAVYWVL